MNIFRDKGALPILLPVLLLIGFISACENTEELVEPSPESGAILIDATPDDITAPWVLTAPDGSSIIGNGDADLKDRAPGTYVLTWEDVEGYGTPAGDSAVLEPGGAIQFADTYIRRDLPTGTVVIDVEPNELAARWFLLAEDSEVRTGSGDSTMADSAVGDYELVWGPEESWESPTPNPMRQTLVVDEQITFAGTYTRLDPGNQGTIVISPAPEGIDAPWTLDGPTGFVVAQGTGAEELPGRPIGDYTITWGSLSGYHTPAQETASLEDGQTLEFSATYEPVSPSTGTVVIQTSPADAPWSLTGPKFSTTGRGETTIPDLEPGAYTVTWQALSGWATPDPAQSTRTLERDRTLTFQGIYSNPDPSVASVSVSPAANMLSVGDTLQLTATPRDTDGNILTNRTVTWASSEPAVADVDSSGLVTANALGETVISATVDGISDSATITVAGSADGSLTVSPSAHTLYGVGDTVTLDVVARAADGSLISDPEVEWSSQATTIAEADIMGKVTARALGTVVIAASAACCSSDSSEITVVNETTSLPVPEESDFIDQGVVLQPVAGTWEDRLTYGGPRGPIKKDGTYFLYYIGASGERADGGPAYRAVGLATSTDGRIWTKSPSNPVIPWSDLNTNGDDEEGAWMVAPMLDQDGTVLLYVTELDGSGGSVNGSIKLFTSSDGVNFTDQGVVVDHADANFPGNDELAVIGAAREPDGGDYHLYYIGKGGSVNWDAVHTSSASRDGFTSGSKILDVAAWVMYSSNPTRISSSEWVMTWTLLDQGIRVYRTSDLANLGTLETTWTGLGQERVPSHALYLDEENNEWLLFVADGPTTAESTGFRLYTAPSQ